MNRKRLNYDPGNAISLEDALSIMIVTFVLFVLFLIPLVNIDKTKLEEAKLDSYWKLLSDYLQQKQPDPAGAPYVHAFSLSGQKTTISTNGNTIYIEAVNSSGDVTIIAHEDSNYVSMMVKGTSAVVTYRYGEIHWSDVEREWFTTNNTIDYGEKDFTVAMQKSYRQFTKQTRGF